MWSHNWLFTFLKSHLFICIFTVHKVDTSVLLCRLPPACSVLGRLYYGMFALLVVILRNSENFFGVISRKPETFHSLFAYFSLCRNFVRELLASIGVPDTAGYFSKELDLFDTTVRLFFVVVGVACVLCSFCYLFFSYMRVPCVLETFHAQFSSSVNS